MKIYQVVQINEHQGFIDEHEFYFGPKEMVAKNQFDNEVWYAKKNPHFNDTIELRVYDSEKPLAEMDEDEITEMMCYGYDVEQSYSRGQE